MIFMVMYYEFNLIEQKYQHLQLLYIKLKFRLKLMVIDLLVNKTVFSVTKKSDENLYQVE